MEQQLEVGRDVLEAVSDIVLTVDGQGQIRDVYFGEGLEDESEEAWLGDTVVETLTPASRKKWENLAREAEEQGLSGPRQISHLLPSGRKIPVRYTGVRMEGEGGLLAVGRDLAAVARLQQELLEAQQSMERDYWRMRQVETRYRLLFQVSSEAVLIVDAESREIADANPAAGALLEVPPEELVGRSFPWGLGEDQRERLDEHLSAARRGEASSPVTVELPLTGETLRVRAHEFRQEDRRFLMVQLRSREPRPDPAEEEGESSLPALQLLRRSPDGFVIVDPDREVLEVNDTFLEMIEAASRDQLIGRSLDEWFGRPGADLDVLEPILRTQGSVRRFHTALEGEVGGVREVEVSGVAALEAEVPCYAFLIRDVERRQEPAVGEGSLMGEAVEDLTELMGQVSMREIVDETVELVERQMISTALEMTGDNRTAAAELLGISRQSLYTKLERYGFDNRDA